MPKWCFFQKFGKFSLWFWNFVTFLLLSFCLLQNALSNLFCTDHLNLWTTSYSTFVLVGITLFYSLLQFSEMQYRKRNVAVPNKFNLLCHSQNPSTSDQSAFSLVLFPNVSPHSLEHGLIFKFTQSLCPQLASLQLSQVPRHILLLFLMFPLMPGGCSLLLCVSLGELGFPIHNYIPS